MVETGAACPHTSSERAHSGLDAHERRQRPEEAAEVGVVGLRGLGFRLRRGLFQGLGPLPREGLLRGFIFLSLLLVARRAPRRALLRSSFLLVLAAREGGGVRFLLLALAVLCGRRRVNFASMACDGPARPSPRHRAAVAT